MKLTINGKEESVLQVSDLASLVAAKKLCPDRLVIEHNHVVIPRCEWGTRPLAENDSIEIVSFVGGG